MGGVWRLTVSWQLSNTLRIKQILGFQFRQDETKLIRSFLKDMDIEMAFDGNQLGDMC